MSASEKETSKMSSLKDSQLRVSQKNEEVTDHPAQEPEEDATEINQSQNEMIGYRRTNIAAQQNAF